MPDDRPRVLIAGVSTRAAAESAARAGFAVTAIDAFGDIDQHPLVNARALPRFSARAAARAARGVPCDAVVYLSSFENHPAAVTALAAGRTMWGNHPDVLRRVRDPFVLAQALREHAFAAPAVVADARNVRRREFARAGFRWLLKPLASGGGRRIRRWRTGASVPRGRYLQEFIEGEPGSIVFVAAGGRAVPLGTSRQLIGDPEFGANGYQYCGSILDPGAGDHDAVPLCRFIAREFGLVGVNGIDFISCRGRAHAVEVNPRWSASMELVELAFGISVFDAHAAACARGTLPAFDPVSARHGGSTIGKAIVFARRDVVVGDTPAWLRDQGAVRDIPQPGHRIVAGQPVCTVFASGDGAAACHAALVRGAEGIYAKLAAWERDVA